MSRSPVNGGWPARRAVITWAARLFRREWRQHVLIVVLLTVAVGGAIAFSCAVANLASTDGEGEFGDANHILGLEDPDPATLSADLERARDWFGEIDAIGHRSVDVPGSVTDLDHRVQDPGGPFGGPMLGLLDGRYPTADDEVAMTEGAAELLGTGIGQTVELDGRTRRVVGVVENPSDLEDDFVLLPMSEMASSDSVWILVDASEDRVMTFEAPHSMRMGRGRDDVPQDLVAALLSIVAGTLALFLVALVAAASFTVIAQRRLPQLGMLSAVGATEKHVRLTMLAGGAVTGIVAAVLGVVLGIGGWFAVEPRIEAAVDHRIDPFDIPWLLVVVAMLLTMGAATAAAWWPGRTMSRIPPVLALSGRPPKPAAIHRSAVVAVGVLAAGITCLFIGTRNTDESVSTLDVILLAVGTVGLVAGVLLMSPIAVRVLTRIAGRVPVGPRVALRDLGRYQARSGAAVAAVGLALGIPAVIVAASAAAANNAGPGNLAANQLLVSAEDLDEVLVPDPDALALMEAGVDELAATLSGATVIPIDVALDPNVVRDPGLPGMEPVFLGYEMDEGWDVASRLFVATPDLLAALGLDPDDVAPSDDIVTKDGGELLILATSTSPGRGSRGWEDAEPVATPGTLPRTYSALPQALIAPERVTEHGWEIAPSGGWIIETPKPLTDDELSAARDVAAINGLVIQSRDDDGGLLRLRFGAVTVGLLLALGILAMTVGLIRAESAADMRTLTATGAGSVTRRSIAATTAAALAALGAALGIAGAYLGLAIGRVSNLLPLPWLDLAAIAVGLPIAAAAAGWLLAGREPRGLARRPIE
jgi:putative ABC transport system permease protein